MTQQTFELRETIEKTFDFLLSTEFHYQRKTKRTKINRSLFRDTDKSRRKMASCFRLFDGFKLVA